MPSKAVHAASYRGTPLLVGVTAPNIHQAKYQLDMSNNSYVGQLRQEVAAKPEFNISPARLRMFLGGVSVQSMLPCQHNCWSLHFVFVVAQLSDCKCPAIKRASQTCAVLCVATEAYNMRRHQSPLGLSCLQATVYLRWTVSSKSVNQEQAISNTIRGRHKTGIDTRSNVLQARSC